MSKTYRTDPKTLEEMPERQYMKRHRRHPDSIDEARVAHHEHRLKRKAEGFPDYCTTEEDNERND